MKGRNNGRGRGNRGGRHHGRSKSPKPHKDPNEFKPADLTLPALRYGRNCRLAEFEKAIFTRILKDFGDLAHFGDNDEYWVPPEVPLLVLHGGDWDALTVLEQMEARELIKARQSLIAKMRNDRAACFGLMWGQLSPESQEKIEEHASWATHVRTKNDPLALLRAIRATHVNATAGVIPVDRQTARDHYAKLMQGGSESLVAFKGRFEDALRRIVATGETAIPAPTQAADFIAKLDPERYSEFKAQLLNMATMRVAEYPATYAAAHTLASAHVVVAKKGGVSGVASETQSVFITSADMIRAPAKSQKGKDKDKDKDKSKADAKPAADSQPKAKDSSHAKSGGGGDKATTRVPFSAIPDDMKGRCLYCYQYGHGFAECDIRKRAQIRDGIIREEAHFTMLEDGHSGGMEECTGGERVDAYIYMHKADEIQTSEEFVPSSESLGPFDCLLDNQASASVIHQRDLLINVFSGQTVSFKGLGGSAKSNLRGDMPYFGEVCYLPKAAANVLSLAEVEDKFPVSYVSGKEFVVTIHKHLKLHFTRRSNRLYVCDMRFLADQITRGEFAFVQTVEDNEMLYTKREVEMARLATRVSRDLGCTSISQLVGLIKSGHMAEIPVSAQDVYRAYKIYGPDPAAIKGKLTARRAPAVSVEHIPRPIATRQVMYVDIFFANKDPYFLSYTSPLGLLMVGHLGRSRGTAAVRKVLDSQLREYRSRDFEIGSILTDGEGAMKTLAHELRGAGYKIEPAGPAQHVPVIERKIRQVKEGMRSVLHSLPYILAMRFLVFLVYFVVSRINMLPSTSRVDSIPAREAFTGRKLNFKRDVRIGFGSFVHVEMPYAVKNSMEARSEPAISLFPVGNIQGSVKFYQFSTATTIVRDRWVALPMPQSTIDQLNAFAVQDKTDMKTAKDPVILLASSNYAEVMLADDEVVLQPMDGMEEPPTKMSGETSVIAADDVPPILSPAGGGEADQHVTAEEIMVDESDHRGEFEEGASLPPPAMPPPSDGPTHSYGTRFKERYNSGTAAADRVEHSFVITYKQALKKWDSKAMEVAIKEMQQMVDEKVFEHVDVKKLSNTQRKKVIRSFMFLREKFFANGDFEKLKARLVAGGHMQERLASEDVSSPTVSLCALMTVAAIAHKEKRKVAVVDVTGAYLKVLLGKDKDIFMRLEPALAAIYVDLDPSFRPFLSADGSLVVRLARALYGCIESAKLWYELLTSALEKQGFVKNPKEHCVLNKMTASGKQITVVVYVDDLFITCEDQSAIDDLVGFLKREFTSITEREGTVHNYLGMTFDFSNEAALKVTMAGYENDVLGGYVVQGTAVTPATNALFDIRASPDLSKEQAEEFHSRVAKLLYLAKRTRPDILTAIAFLSTRVSQPTEDDWLKLERVLKYLNGSKGMGIMLTVDDGIMPKVYIDASYAVHSDGKSHTGVFITLGSGPIYVQSSKQKLVSKSSTEAELIGVSDGLSQFLWVREFILYQGYNFGATTLYQDNMSTIALATKGPTNAPGTRHIHIRYFFIKDRVDSNEVVIVHMPTEQMISDYFTKPLQGAAFREKRGLILNWSD